MMKVNNSATDTKWPGMGIQTRHGKISKISQHLPEQLSNIGLMQVTESENGANYGQQVTTWQRH